MLPYSLGAHSPGFSSTSRVISSGKEEVEVVGAEIKLERNDAVGEIVRHSATEEGWRVGSNGYIIERLDPSAENGRDE
jgi:hypothetical protein